MEKNIELRISALLELMKANISYNRAQLAIQMETLEIQHIKWPEQSAAFLFVLFFGLISILGLGFSITALGISLSIVWIQNLGWATAALSMIAIAFLSYRFKRLRIEWQARDKKIAEVRKLFQTLTKDSTSV